MIRNYDKLILKSNTNNSPIMSPKSYMKINSPNKDGSINKNFISPRKNFERNMCSNGMNPWFCEKERKVEELTSKL